MVRSLSTRPGRAKTFRDFLSSVTVQCNYFEYNPSGNFNCARNHVMGMGIYSMSLNGLYREYKDLRSSLQLWGE